MLSFHHHAKEIKVSEHSMVVVMEREREDWERNKCTVSSLMYFGSIVVGYQVLLLIQSPHSDEEEAHSYCHSKENTDDIPTYEGYSKLFE